MNRLIMPYLKAISGALVTGLVAARFYSGDGALDLQDWIEIAIAFFGAMYAVGVTPNKPYKL